jgi:hypothetical protein
MSWGIFDDETYRLEPIENPFGSRLLPADELRRVIEESLVPAERK